jgi:hypothetical protein
VTSSLLEFRESLTCHPVRSTLIALACILFGGFVAAPATEFFRYPPVVKILADARVDGVIQGSAGYLPLEVNISHPQSCDAKITRVFWRWKPGSMPRYREEFTFEYMGKACSFPGETHCQRDLPIPPRLEPGLWNYTAFYAKSCSWVKWWWPDDVKQSADTPVPNSTGTLTVQ